MKKIIIMAMTLIALMGLVSCGQEEVEATYEVELGPVVYSTIDESETEELDESEDEIDTYWFIEAYKNGWIPEEAYNEYMTRTDRW